MNTSSLGPDPTCCSPIWVNAPVPASNSNARRGPPLEAVRTRTTFAGEVPAEVSPVSESSVTVVLAAIELVSPGSTESFPLAVVSALTPVLNGGSVVELLP